MGLWSDFLAKFNKGPEGAAGPAGSIDVTPGSEKPARGAEPPPAREGWLARWRPGSRRDRQIAWLQAGYSEMLDMVRSIRQHLDRQ